MEESLEEDKKEDEAYSNQHRVEREASAILDGEESEIDEDLPEDEPEIDSPEEDLDIEN